MVCSNLKHSVKTSLLGYLKLSNHPLSCLSHWEFKVPHGNNVLEVINRELTNKNKHVLKKHMCVLGKHVLKNVLLVWFGSGWEKIVQTVRLLLSQHQPNQEHTFLTLFLERTHVCSKEHTFVLFNTYVFLFVKSLM